MAYTLKGGVGNRRVAFKCAGCSAALESPLEEAGQRFPCPTCATEFVTPGVKELRQQEEAAKAAEAERAAAARARFAAADSRRIFAEAERAAAEKVGTEKAGTAGGAPEYAEIVRGEKVLRTFASVIAALGWFELIVAVIGVVAAVAGNAPTDALAVSISCAAGGLMSLVVAVLLRMFGALAIAIRDIARNSFRP